MAREETENVQVLSREKNSQSLTEHVELEVPKV